MRLSRLARRKINWQRIDDSAIGVTTRGAPIATADQPEELVREQQSKQIERVFETARNEFQTALKTLNVIVRVLLLIAGVAAACCIGGLLLATVGRQVLGGAIFTGAGTASLLGLFASVRSIGRDQAMLEVLPTRYELAFQLATTTEDRRKLLERFMDETASLRRK